MTPLEPFTVMTPLGIAQCIGILDELNQVEWATFILATGEPWFWRNPFIRLRRTASNGLNSSSPFYRLNDIVRREIERYIENGWLPEHYDPSNSATWPL